MLCVYVCVLGMKARGGGGGGVEIDERVASYAVLGHVLTSR